MKLSKQTIAILKWASTIQGDLMMEPGNRIRTISSNKAILFDATVQETFPSECGVKCLGRVLDFIDDSTEISFDSPTHLELFNGRRTTRVPKLDRKIIHTPPRGNINVKHYDEGLFLHSDDVFEIRGLKGDKTVVEFHAAAENESIQMDCFATDEALIQTFALVRPKKANQRFRVRMKVPNLKLWEGSYQVDIASAGAARFSWLNGNVVLYISLEQSHSHFGIPEPHIATPIAVQKAG